MLGDATGLACDDVGVPDRVEQLRLSVVHVTHDRDHRWAWHCQLGIVLLHHFTRREVLAVAGGQPLALLQGHPAHRGVLRGVDPLLLHRGKKNLHPPEFLLQ